VGAGGDDVERLLRDAALRATRPRRAVLAAVHAHPHATTDALLSAARARLGTVSHQAVYDVLRALTDAGLVRRIQPAGSVALYEARVGCAVGETPCLTAAEPAGFEVDEAEVVYWGRCPACTAAAPAPRPPSSPTPSHLQRGTP
jgi:Fur family ferric uptake transcriptional regulator